MYCIKSLHLIQVVHYHHRPESPPPAPPPLHHQGLAHFPLRVIQPTHPVGGGMSITMVMRSGDGKKRYEDINIIVEVHAIVHSESTHKLD